MKKILSLVFVLLLPFVASNAQDWTVVLNSINGLPGVSSTTSTGGEYYNFVSQVYSPGTTTQKIRLTVLDTEEHEQPNGNNYCFSLSNLVVYDGSGNEVSYVASSNADHNSLAAFSDGDGLSALSDGDYDTYFHSMWSSYNAVTDYHYVELSLSQPLSSFSLEWGTRVNQPKNAPIKVALTLGSDYVESSVGEEFALGNFVSTASGLSQAGQLFVLMSNNQTSFTTSDGTYYSGNGPVYMTCAEKGTTSATFANVVQFIPSGEGYLVYWPSAGVFLKDCGSDYNGKNGWQFSTTNIDEAAVVFFNSVTMGDFEISYTSTYKKTESDTETTTVTDLLYVGADIRENTQSKTKTFAPDKKTALESGDYTQGYALPVAFNWSVYKASLDASTVESVSISVAQIATMKLSPAVTSAKKYLAEYGDFNGAGTSEISDLNAAIATAESYMADGASPTIEQIDEAAATLSLATVKYIAVKLNVYKDSINGILENETFSTYPYVNGTYPETSRALLESSLATIETTQASIDSYSSSQLLTIYSQIESDIARFYTTIVTTLSFPIVYTSTDGLPGSLEAYGGYVWQTPQIFLNKNVSGVRITFNESNNSSQLYNGYPMISLAEVVLYDGESNAVTLTSSAFATNSQELSEGPLADICDGSDETYWHSIWKSGTMDPEGEVYVDVNFPSSMKTFSLELRGRNTAALMPTKITLTAIESDNGTAIDGEAIYVYLTDGGVDAFPAEEVDGGYYTEGEFTIFPLTGGDVIYYTAQEFDSISSVAPTFPEFTSYKFNNKFNPNLNVDAIAETIEENMLFSLNAIGKYLTASFQLSDDKAVVFIDTVQQESKVTRQSFETPKIYTVTYPGYNKVLGAYKVKDAVWEYSSETAEDISLTADMLATNKPSTQSDEGVGNLLDGNSSTIFHSTWGSANNATIDVDAYITIALPSAVENIKLYYQCRPQSGYNPLVLDIYASNDGSDWSLMRTLTTADGLPTGGSGQEYTSPTIYLGGSYSHLKIEQTSGEYSKNHMALAEMRVYDVTLGDSVLVSDAVYETKRVPFGRNYNVEVDWLIDNAVSVPRIDIDIVDGAEVVDKDVYLDANFRITGFGIYDNFEDSVQIKGRGNSSWTSTGKKPYRLKFASKVKPFGLTKGKSWVLLANRQDNSMLANAVAMKVGQMSGAEYTNHIIPVDLYVNGTYRGNYMFTEKVGISNNSVDIDDELGYLLELDTYYDETYKFKSTKYSLPVNIKDPDLSEYTTDAAATRKALIEEDFNALDAAVYNFNNEAVDSLLDADAFARFMLANELVLNQEIGHPKSTFLFKEELENLESKITFGPLWDFDWGYGYESTADYATVDYKTSVFKSSMSSESGYKFFGDLMSLETIQKHYYNVWTEFLDKNSMAELLDYMDCYYNFVKSSLESNATVWGDGNDYEAVNTRMKEWISDRANYLYSSLDVYDLDEFIYPLACDVDKSNYLTVHDVAVTTAYLKGNTHSSFTYSKADTDADGSITATDVTTIENAVLNVDPLEPMQYYNTPIGIGELGVKDFELLLDENSTLPIEIVRYDSENYKALQMDITVPDGVMIMGAEAAGSLTDHKVTLSQRDLTTYRIIIYSDGDEMFDGENDAIVNLSLLGYMAVEESARNIKFSNILVVDEATDELRINDAQALFSVSTSIEDVTAPTISVKGGDALTVTVLASQNVRVYSVDGRLVRNVRVGVGSTRIELPAGIYVVLGQKVVIK